MSEKSKISTESYKGVRDFYPEDLFIQKHIFNNWRKVVESFGYLEYNASVLEPAELYKAKSGEEIVNNETYTFIDRGEREVTLRPEMTPTVARLVAGKSKELVFPLRWYSIPNLFRYEKPQKGRLREHWQLNVDLFGVDSLEADTEILSIAHKIMTSFGAKEEDFMIKVNSRKIMNDFYAYFKLTPEQSQKISKIIDKKNKIPAEVFAQSIEEVLGSENAKSMISMLSSTEKLLEALGNENAQVKELVGLLESLEAVGIKNTVFDPTLMRGFDYYTGIIFEVFDTNPENNRSILGGGRYDDLLDIFNAEKVPAVGFGAGDVTIQDFLLTHGLTPKYKASSDLYICTLDKSGLAHAQELAEKLRISGLNVAVNLSTKKIGDQIKTASRQSIPYTIVIGDDEIKSGIYPVKNLETGEEKKVKLEEIKNIISK